MDQAFHPPNKLVGHLGDSTHSRAVVSSAMLLRYFGFQQEPFGVSPDPRCLYLSRTHREALELLENGFYSNRGFTAMIAPPGMGKTTLLFRFLEDTRETARSIFLFDIDADCEPRDFVAYILRDIGVTPAQTSSEMHEQLSRALAAETQAGRKFVVVIDEAQNLSDAVLERVRLLTNFETSQGKLIQIILSGQPQLSDKLLKASLVQLRQRISTICRIEPLPAEETAPYINYRMKLAGYDGEPLFTEGALKLITEASHGTPRTINNLCFNALSLCYTLNSKQVDGSMVAKVIADLHLIPHSTEPVATAGNVAAVQPNEPIWKRAAESLKLWVEPKWNQASGSPMFWVPAAAVLLVMCVLGVLRLTEPRAPQSRKTSDDSTLNQEAAPGPVLTTAAADSGKTIATEPPRDSQRSDSGNGLSQPSSAPTSATAQTAAASQALLQAKGSIPKPSAATVQPAAPTQKLLQANGSIPEPSVTPAYPATSTQKLLQASGSIPEPSAAAQAAVTPQASAEVQPPSPGAGVNPATPQQSPASAGQSALPESAPAGAGGTQVRAALEVTPPEVVLPVAASKVRPDVRPAFSGTLTLTVQVVATAHPEDADSLVSALQKRGYPVTARREPADNLIHVRVGPFYSRDEANQWRVKLIDDGYNAIIQP